MQRALIIIGIILVVCVCILLAGGVAAYFMFPDAAQIEQVLGTVVPEGVEATATAVAEEVAEEMPGVTPEADPAEPTPAEESAPAEDTAPAEAPAGGSDFTTAEPIAPGTIEGAVEGEAVYYLLDIPPAAEASITMTPGADVEGSLDITMYDPEQSQVWRETSINPTVSQGTTHLMDNSSGGGYYLVVEPRSGSGGSFTLDIAFTPQNDAGQGGDAGDELLQATAIELNSSITGQVGSYDEYDYYVINVDNGQIINLSFTPAEDVVNGSLDITTYDPEQSQLWRETSINATVTESNQQVMNHESGGNYYIQINTRGGAYGGYTLEVTADTQADAGTAGDAPGRLIDGFQVEPGQSYTGFIGDFDGTDAFIFTGAPGQTVEFTPGADLLNGTLDVMVFDPEQNQLWRETSIDAGVTQTFQLPEEAAEGPYYLQIQVRSGAVGPYSFQIQP